MPPRVPGRDFDDRDLHGKAFACLEDCGFCCTMQPEVNARDIAALSVRLQRPVPVAAGEGRTYLRLQNACGACTLLARRGCSQYDLRPAHCRYFPFHVYFGDVTESYVNFTCRGVERRAGAALHEGFAGSVLANEEDGVWARGEREARETYAQFRELAEDAGAWEEPAPLVARAAKDAAALFTASGLEAAAAEAGERVGADAIAAMALEPFANPRPESRPYYLAPDLQWLTFARRGAGALKPASMTEDGRFTPEGGSVDGLDRWQELPDALARALGAYVVDGLLARALFTGSVFARVDDDEYESTVREAVHARLVEVASDLALRARLVAARDPTLAGDAARWADEAARFYDTEFLDAPTIGGFL